MSEPAIVQSARRHGIADDDMLHAFRNPIRIIELDDLVQLVGADASGRLLEVGVVRVDGIELILHAMPARDRFLE